MKRDKPKRKGNHTDSGEALAFNLKKSKQTPDINGVSAVAALKTRKRFKEYVRVRLPSGNQRHWKEPLAKRIAGHEGYTNIDVQSIYDTSIIYGVPHKLDSVPWERRRVPPNFLNQERIDTVQNWFGELSTERVSRKAREPISHPKSAIMNVSDNSCLASWKEEWYTTWRSRKENPNKLNNIVTHGQKKGANDWTGMDAGSEGSIDSMGFDQSDSFTQIEFSKRSEIGTICTIRFKIGERVSRVHPKFTSSLRKSRWKKKYFPKGIFMGM